MCGFAGFIGSGPTVLARRDRQAVLRAMGQAIVHRGPDSSGVWMDAEDGVAMVHNRLAILDLSSLGHQPMVSPSGRFTIAFNGEIYNHLRLRDDMAKAERVVSWRGHSDTETFLASLDAWGLVATLQASVGMFAFALWDKAERALYLGRDRMGEKPLYYGWQNNAFLFGSELKALKAHPSFRGEIDREALTLFLRHGYIPAPRSIYQSIWKLPPATFLKLPTRDALFRTAVLPNPVPYWSLSAVVEDGHRDPFPGSDADAVSALDVRLRESICLQKMADVPLGAFLSGGVDSSTVVALLQAESNQSVKTFTIGFGESGYDEAKDAKAVARHLGTDHTEMYVTSNEAMDVIPRLPSLYDEPFSDPSQIPTFLVARLARRLVTVSLSGDGGDELFGGYIRHFWGPRLWRRLRMFPVPLRARLARLITMLPPTSWNTAFTLLSPFVPSKWSYANPGDKLHKLARLLTIKSPDEIYLGMISQWDDPAKAVIDGHEPRKSSTADSLQSSDSSLEDRVMYMDTMGYLPDDILVKVDRAAMGVSLETRVPFLDHRVVEFAWKLPLSLKIRNGRGKWILRQVLHKYVPMEMVDRPKMGFSVPIDSWLRGPLKGWAEALLAESSLAGQGFFQPRLIQRKWLEHLSGRRNWASCLWSVLMFQAWLESERSSR